MKMWLTTIHALDPMDGMYKEFNGPVIEAPSKKRAHEFCQNNGLGYCHIGDEVIILPPCNDCNIPDWEKKIDYDKIDLN